MTSLSRPIYALAALLIAVCAHAQEQVQILSPDGQPVKVAASSPLTSLEAPALSPAQGEDENATAADCFSGVNAFWGDDFMSTTTETTESASDCCFSCKLANDCTMWNWCGKEDGCILPPDMAAANQLSKVEHKTCLWKPRPLSYAGTLPLAPQANVSSAMQGWTSGIPINGSLIPNLQGFKLKTGVEMEYSVENDFYCQGSTTTKSVCQLYGNAKGGAAACLSTAACRGFQMCWSFPVWGTSYQQSAVIRMKAGLGPLNITGALQNPYCSIYTVDDSIFEGPDGENERQYALRQAYNGTAVAEYQYSVLNGNASGANPLLGAQHNRKLLQDPAQDPSSALAPTALSTGLNSTTPATVRPAIPAPTNFTTTFLGGRIVQAYDNATFNYTQCYSNAPKIHVTLQSQLFPLTGPVAAYSIHTWTEKPFRNSGSVCCAFQDVNDIFLNLESGAIAVAEPSYIATSPNLTNGEPLRSYETRPSSLVSPLIYIPPNQMNIPGGLGRQYSLPRINSSDYVSALEQLYFSVSQTALGDQFCSPGYSQLGRIVNILGQMLANYTTDAETAGGIPTGLTYLNAANTTATNSTASPPLGSLVESGAEFEGDTLTVIEDGKQTIASCAQSCWLYIDTESQVDNQTCDIWVLNTEDGSCELRNSTLAASMQIVDVLRDDSTTDLVSGKPPKEAHWHTAKKFDGIVHIYNSVK